MTAPDPTILAAAIKCAEEDLHLQRDIDDPEVNKVRALVAAAKAYQPWQPIETAKKDGTVISAVLRADIYPRLCPARDDLKRWNGLQVPLRHPGVAKDGFDIGWNIAAPVGHGGFPDEWIAGWMPLPAPPIERADLPEGEREAIAALNPAGPA